MVLKEDGTPDFGTLQTVVKGQLEADAKYDRENDAKFRAVFVSQVTGRAPSRWTHSQRRCSHLATRRCAQSPTLQGPSYSHPREAAIVQQTEGGNIRGV